MTAPNQPVAASPALRWVAIGLHVLVGIFPFSATGLMAPAYGLVIVVAIWLVGGALVLRLGKTRPGVAVAIPFIELAAWFVLMWVGDAWLDWTA